MTEADWLEERQREREIGRLISQGIRDHADRLTEHTLRKTFSGLPDCAFADCREEILRRERNGETIRNRAGFAVAFLKRWEPDETGYGF